MVLKVTIKPKKNNKYFFDLLNMNRQKIEVGTVTNYRVGNSFDAIGLSNVLDSGSSRGVTGWNYNEKAFEKFKPVGTKLFKDGIKKIVKGKFTVSAMTNQIGIEASSRYKAMIEDIKTPPNAPSTIARKGFNNPMIDTGKFKSNIAAKINDNRIVGRGVG